ncbi:MAG: hypothetical protein NT154_39915 [Verrucomicrobia bacterium]|nr:hypothetical protein [Verrucomicrobiota bacterium]
MRTPTPTHERRYNAPNKCHDHPYRAKHNQGHGTKEKHLTPNWHPGVQLKLQWLKLQDAEEAKDGTDLTCQQDSDGNDHAHRTAEPICLDRKFSA